ncbi:hypothetical protein I4U23_003720 [Adineta vaga]|nr:hypothetical protein I4U23_003720 [Adineta vaga]
MNCENNYRFFQALELTVPVAGNYTIESVSAMDTDGYLYTNDFDSSYMGLNELAYDDDTAGNGQFLITQYLQTSVRYIVVLSNVRRNMTGTYKIIFSGLGSINLSPINVTGSPLSLSCSSHLTIDNPKFRRPYSSSSSSFYYTALNINQQF